MPDNLFASLADGDNQLLANAVASVRTVDLDFLFLLELETMARYSYRFNSGRLMELIHEHIAGADKSTSQPPKKLQAQAFAFLGQDHEAHTMREWWAGWEQMKTQARMGAECGGDA